MLAEIFRALIGQWLLLCVRRLLGGAKPLLSIPSAFPAGLVTCQESDTGASPNTEFDVIT